MCDNADQVLENIGPVVDEMGDPELATYRSLVSTLAYEPNVIRTYARGGVEVMVGEPALRLGLNTWPRLGYDPDLTIEEWNKVSQGLEGPGRLRCGQHVLLAAAQERCVVCRRVSASIIDDPPEIDS